MPRERVENGIVGYLRDNAEQLAQTDTSLAVGYLRSVFESALVYKRPQRYIWRGRFYRMDEPAPADLLAKLEKLLPKKSS